MTAMTAISPDLQTHWCAVSPLLSVRNEEEYDLAVERLNRLLDEVGTNEQHPLYSLMDTLGTVVAAYEGQQHPIPECRGIDVLQYLMEDHGLTPADLPEVGSEKVILEILQGERELNTQQIRALTERFGVSGAVFL
jgi:HTH-type transcriptional regulator/antitoxin HigA